MLARTLLCRVLSRNFSSVWEKRIDDFTPVHIESHGNVFVRQYDWKADSIEPKTKLIYPESGTDFSCTDSLKLSNVESSDEITAQIPIKSPLFVKCGKNGNVDVTGHEADVDIKTHAGSCTLTSVKCTQTSIISKSGDIQLNSIVSNCSIMTGGNVHARKVQGESITISSTSGSVNIGSLYAPESQIFGKYGDITIDNVHGSCKIVSGRGSVTIGSSQDNLDIRCRGGAVNVTVHEINQSVSIQSFGGPVILYLTGAVCSKCILSISSSSKAEVTDEVKMLVNKNREATALVYVDAYDGAVFVAKAKSWGEGIWNKLKDKDLD